MFDPTQFLVLGAIIAGVTELITRLRAKDFWVVGTIVCSALIGFLFGLSGYFPGLDAVEGVVYGFGASGAITAIGATRSKATPSSLVEKR